MGDGPHGMELSERAQYLFKTLVERYIADGQPVGSRTLARDTGLELSPATIRNVMADLEDLGLIRAPHTSAGRVPTARGYRFFVDSILTYREPALSDVRRFANDLQHEGDVRRLLEKTSTLLSDVTQFVGLVMVPITEQRALRQVEFLPLNDNRVLAILVVNEREVQNRMGLFMATARIENTPDVQRRLIPQVVDSLIDERLKMQEARRLKVTVTTEEVRSAVNTIEDRNGMQPGTLRAMMDERGIDMDTLYGQIESDSVWVNVTEPLVRAEAKVAPVEVSHARTVI